MKRAASLFLVLAACAAPKPAARPAPRAAASAAWPTHAAPAEVAHAPAAPATIPELTLEPFTVDGKPFDGVFVIEGATILTRDNVTGYLTPDDKVEWIAKVPKETVLAGSLLGPTRVYDVKGRYPDSVDVFYETLGRATIPTYVPLTGKGTLFVLGAFGSSGTMFHAQVGASTVLAKWGPADPYAIVTVRGPALRRTFQPQSSCKPGEVEDLDRVGNATAEESPQVVPYAFASTANGRIVAIGHRCKQESAAEVWDPGQTTSHLVDLRPTWKRLDGWWATLLRGAGDDELWGLGSGFDDLLHVSGGKFMLGPHLERRIARIFASPSRQLYAEASDGTIYRLDDERWQPIAHVTVPTGQRVWDTMIDDRGTLWMMATPSAYAPGRAAFRLRETGRLPADPPCASWFVHVVTARPGTIPAKWTYPTTQKALAGFPEAADVHLVEMRPREATPIEMGVAVKSREQGAAVVAYMTKTAPDLRPKLLCYTPENVTRTIPLAAP